jgi:hypothetical protein
MLMKGKVFWNILKIGHPAINRSSCLFGNLLIYV